jgi:oligopeptide transport system substrate-binding protein
MKHWLFILILFSNLVACHKKADQKKDDYFTLNLFSEPSHLDPSKMRGSSSSYLFQNTLRGLYRFDEKLGLVEEGGKCLWLSSLKLKCEIFEQHWSNGELVTSYDYLKNIYLLVDPNRASPRADILSQVKNAKKILKGQLQPREIGIQALDKNHLLFNFDSPDIEFLYKLTSTALVPLHKNHPFNKSDFKNFVSNGPYQIKSWNFGKELILIPNPYFKNAHKQRPSVKFYFIEDEMTAYRLYLNHQLDFLRRVPSKLISSLQNRNDFHFIPMARFDYIGFGKRLMNNKNIRLALAQAVNYDELKILLHALGRPGCPSLPSGWIDNPPCIEFNIEKAKTNLALIKKPFLNLNLKVSQMGGEDIKQQAEFFQNQWKKNLGVIVQINQVEQKVFLQELQNNPPDIFRKGVGLDWPTCLNALETFSPDGKQNYFHWQSQDYKKILVKLKVENDPQEYKKLCREAIVKLMDEAIIIPLGEMHFSILASPKYTGWSLNSMNQLDLSQLHFVHP